MVQEINDPFWNQRIAVTRSATLPAIYDQLKKTGRWDAMRLTWKKGDSNEPHIFWDSDIAKLVESLCFAVMHMDKADKQYQGFMAWIDDAIDMIGKAQRPDGYINIHFTVVEPENRWTDVAHQHELYCAGHLLESAVAHYELTKSTKYLDIMCKYIDYICKVFGPGEGQLHGFPGHEEIELALVKLYKYRPENRYLDMLTYFVEQRGHNGGKFYDQEAINKGIDPMKFIPGRPGLNWPNPPCHWYMQAEDEIRNLKEINGHSVRAMYYLTGVQGLANINKDQTLTDAVNRLWRNMIDKKFYVHGGIGAIASWEGFGKNYELPLDCYAETCASLGILFLGQRRLENKLDSEVCRVMERALYNDAIGGVSLDGTSFFYDQPLYGKGLKRSDWFEVSCCPPNLSRLLNSLERYAFTEHENSLSLNMWMGGTYETDKIKATIRTDYPLHGNISIELKSNEQVGFALVAPPTDYTINIAGDLEKDGYIHFTPREWNTIITVSYTVTPHIKRPDSNVEATKSMLYVERGPFVYGLEQTSCPVPVKDITISESTKLVEETVTVQTATIVALNMELPNGKTAQLLPYFVLGNRVPGEDFVLFFPEK